MTVETLEHVLERLSGLLRGDLRSLLAEQGLQPVQLEALAYLARANRYSDTPKAVTEYLGQTKGTVSQTLKVLENRGLLIKNPDIEDRRVTHLAVSPAGHDLLAKARPAPLLRAATQTMSPKAVDDLQHRLVELLSGMQAANGFRRFGQCAGCRYNQPAESGDFWCGLTQEPLSHEDVKLICREFEAA